MKRALSALFCLLVPSGVLAVSTKSFVIDTSDAFEKGEFEGVASYESGRLGGAPATERIPVQEPPVATCSVLGSDDAVYIGTGNEGAIYRVTPSGAKRFAKSDAAAITSLALVGDTLYAGSLPGGRIFAIDKKGNLKDWVSLPGADDVWALGHDAKRDLLYAATGPEGKLFSIDRNGEAKLVYDDPAEHLLSLAFDSEGRVLVGTSNGARVVRIVGDEGRVLHDFPGQEVTGLAVRAGIIAVAANEFPDAPPLPTAPHAASAVSGTDSGARLKRPKPGNGKLFVMNDAGHVDELYASDQAHISAVEVDASGRGVLAGLAQDGRIVRVGLDGERALWVDVDERQIVSLGLSSRKPYFVTSDGVAVYREHASAQGGKWTSAVLDAKFPARWGDLQFRGRGQVRLQTRSGNTERPDATWSDWSQELTNSGPIHSVASRFLQIRALLSRDAEFYALTAYYLADNQPARVRNVRLKLKPKDEKSAAPAKPADPSAARVLPLTWDIDNPDEDKLRYRLFYRRDEHNTWLSMQHEHEVLEQNDYAWDTRAVPDGHYRVRVVATDELVNPAPYVRKMEALSAPLLVDNHAPEIRELTVSGRNLRGRIVDNIGPVSSIDISVDGAAYAPLFPDDDLLDTRDERFDVELRELAIGTHIISVRTLDAGQNVGSRAIEFTIPR